MMTCFKGSKFWIFDLLLVLSACVGTRGGHLGKDFLESKTKPLSAQRVNERQVREKITKFRRALERKVLTRTDWTIHDELLNDYVRLKNGVHGTSLTLPSGSRISIGLPSFCLNSNKAIPDDEERFRWRKGVPYGIPYYKDIIDLASKSKNKSDYQTLLWNLQVGTHWEEYPQRLKEIILKIDPSAAIKLPSEMKSKASNFLSDLIDEHVPGTTKTKELVCLQNI